MNTINGTITAAIPHGWSGGEPVTKWWRGKFIHLYRLTKNCAQCGANMVLDVTKAAIDGTAKNAGLHLTRCAKCREASRLQGSTSRPVIVETPPEVNKAAAPSDPADTAKELRELRSFKATVTEELLELDSLRREVMALKAELARYRPWTGTPENNSQKLPWSA